MARYSQKSQYKKVEDRVIYSLHSPVGKDFFIGHCRKDLLKDVYKDHCRGERYKTAAMTAALKARGLRPCLHILDTVTCTKVEAYRHVIAWTRILCDNGYHNLDHGNVSCYVDDMLPDTHSVYDRHCNAALDDLLHCDNCFVKVYARKLCPNFTSTDTNQ